VHSKTTQCVTHCVTQVYVCFRKHTWKHTSGLCYRCVISMCVISVLSKIQEIRFEIQISSMGRFERLRYKRDTISERLAGSTHETTTPARRASLHRGPTSPHRTLAVPGRTPLVARSPHWSPCGLPASPCATITMRMRPCRTACRTAHRAARRATRHVARHKAHRPAHRATVSSHCSISTCEG